jgi:hypothetical protein
MMQCAERSSSAIDWQNHVETGPGHVLEAVRSLGVGGAYPDCAIEGFRAVIAYDTSLAGEPLRYAAAVGLQSMLVATNRIDEVILLLDTASLYPENLRPHYIIDALAGAPVEDRAEEEAERLRSGFPDLRDWEVWCLGIWEAHRGRPREARALRDTLVAWSLANDRRRTKLVAASLSAHVALAEADTALAIRLLEALSPNVRRGSLYFPWESLGLERLFLAKTLLARGRYEEAFETAALFDSPGAANLLYPAFLPASFGIRSEAAGALGDEEALQAIESRLRALGR